MRRFPLILGLAAWTTLAAATGCASRRGMPTVAPEALAIHARVIGRSVEGRAIEQLTVGDGPITVMFIASIHGDEPAGTSLLDRLAREAVADPRWMRDRTLTLVPVANPDGFASNRRGNARGVDLNRNFPARSFTQRRRHGQQPLSEPEAQALHDVILSRRPERIISIHQPLACIDYDGDGAALAQAMADALDAKHRLPVRKLGAMPGSLGSFAGEDLGIPIITVEFDREAHTLDAEAMWRAYGMMLIEAVAFPALSSSAHAHAPAPDS